jgi:hypothetical protein
MDKYIPSRLQAPRPVRKACRDCKEVKPNDFQHFGKKWNGTRTDYTTVDVCLVCRNAKISQGMQKKWAVRKGNEAPVVPQVTSGDDENPLLKKLREEGLLK